ncbi:cysteine desulfurase, sulfur acceptor subunit CsdE [Xenorhabdus beddingii]|uniref:Cysteine desulfurase, sulfur acceptor subunit CsdE n=1 Tax=Xenorhabdus beddingii TaxID=40578 RepID=A0A1Y2SLJ6_9GAMM|nr:cysteine desulfurase sulfur acceptor subunit CsdE [Xenorhabdus beddingii]OTA19842.1 cysteine desulfurase, sulfur acceptor subunit CsdE [Xenorhabdus beddingii]
MTQLSDTLLVPHPFGTEITEQQLIENFQQCKLWEDRYRQLIGLARKLPPLADEFKQQHIERSGCENRVWLGYQRLSDGRLHFYGDSEGRIVKGLLAILLTAVEGKTPAQISQMPLTEFFQQLGLEQQLSGSRLNGVRSLINTIQEIARTDIN